jgi:hypothetical protein
MNTQFPCPPSFTRLAFLLMITVAGIHGNPATAGPADRETASLNGIWDFHPEGGASRHEIRVPSFWDAPQDYVYPAEWLHMRHGVYRKTFTIPPSMRDKQVFLSIQRLSVIAKVFINGRQAGGEDSKGYLMMQLPYLIDITPHLMPKGDNQLEVRVWGGKSMIDPTDTQDKLMEADDFPPDTKIDGRFLFPYCVDHWDGRRGINGDVALVAKPKVHVADVFIIPDLHKNGDPKDDEIMIRMTLANHDSTSRQIRIANRAIRVGGAHGKNFESLTVTLPANSTMEVNVGNTAWNDAAYWWPHDPALYVMETTLTEKGQAVDRIETRFGFREFYVMGDHYELNGIRANLRGDAYEFSWHEGYRHGPSTAPVFSTKELMPHMQEQLVREYAKLNHNMLRPHKASAYAGLYDLCDEIGMMVLDEAPFWETWVRTDERSKPYYEAWVRRWIRNRRNHPSIMAWIGANECWFGATGVIAVQAIRSMDASRPSFHEDPWGSGIHHDDLEEPYEGDEDCRHYTGGYPIKALNTENLYEVYRANPRKPTGEGESFYPEGFPLMNPDGTLANKVSARGEFGHPDMISQAQWLRSVCRMFRAMRYAGLSDARLYANWMLAFDPIEADIPLEWNDPSAPGIQPNHINRPILNVFTDKHPRVRYNDGYTYYQNSFSAVAVYDKEGDRQNRIGAPPLVFQPKEALARTLVVFNDEFHGGEEITVRWCAESSDPQSGKATALASGTFTIPVPYGAKREQLVKFDLPEKLEPGRWLNLVLSAAKPGGERFRESNRLGALLSAPSPKLVVKPDTIDLGRIPPQSTGQWHTVRLLNAGGGASIPWTMAGAGQGVNFKQTSGTLRIEQDIHFQVDASKIAPGSHARPITITCGDSGSATVMVRFQN